MAFDSNIIKNHILYTFKGVDKKTLKRTSKKKDEKGCVIREFYTNLGIITVKTNKSDSMLISVTLDGQIEPRLTIKDLSGKIVISKKTMEGENASYAYECIFEHESWVEEGVLNLLKLELDEENYLEYDGNNKAVVKIIAGKVHKYNLTLE